MKFGVLIAAQDDEEENLELIISNFEFGVNEEISFYAV